MNRRTFFTAVAGALALGLVRPSDAAADLPKAKVTRVRIYRPPNLNPLFNQSNMLVTVETNQVGESEADKLAKRFLTIVHTMAEPTHRPIGAY